MNVRNFKTRVIQSVPALALTAGLGLGLSVMAGCPVEETPTRTTTPRTTEPAPTQQPGTETPRGTEDPFDN